VPGKQGGHDVVGILLPFWGVGGQPWHDVPVHLSDGAGGFSQPSPQGCQRRPVLATCQPLQLFDKG